MDARAFVPLAACLTLAALATPGVAKPARDSVAVARPRSWIDAAGHANGSVPANGTTLHYVDYGGSGPALVFLAGLGNSAHVFDEFAPRFTDAYHVLAFTRRGYGESGRPRDGYDTGTLAQDVLALLDSLAVPRAVLAGHSVAGDELTEFAARYPERTAALVYLDAAHDRSHTTRRLLGMAVLGQVPPAPPRPSGRDRASAEAARDYLQRIYGVRWPATEIAATRTFDARGRWTRDATPASTNGRIMRGECAPRWSEVRAPALALYAVDRSEARDFAWIETIFVGRGAARLRAHRFRAAQNRWEAGQRAAFARSVPAARVVELHDASHYLFLSHGERVEREMREFLAGLGLATTWTPAAAHQ